MQQFWNKVNKGKVEECWLWTGTIRSKTCPYGIIKINGKAQSTHRLSYELAYGPIPKEMFVCHKCDNPPCVNPNHLFIGTRSDNTKDCYSKKRMKIPYGVKFPKGYNAKLTEKEIEEIKKLPPKNYRIVGKKYGVDHSRIWQIINNR